MNTFAERLTKGRESEGHFRDLVIARGLTVCYISQHRDNPVNKLARHFPDFFIVEKAVFVQVKDGRRSADFPSVIIEDESYRACLALAEYGNNVLVVWEMPDGSFCGNRVENLISAGAISDEARRNGSGTPAIKILKSCLVRWM